jgi:hypothetical protein
MRYVELFRQIDNDGDVLTPKGIRAAESIGLERLSPPYAFFGSPGAHRATQMVEILRRAARQEEVSVTEVPGLRSSVEDRWRAAARAAGKGATVEKMRSTRISLIQSRCSLAARFGPCSTLCPKADGPSSSATALPTRPRFSAWPARW